MSAALSIGKGAQLNLALESRARARRHPHPRGRRDGVRSDQGRDRLRPATLGRHLLGAGHPGPGPLRAGPPRPGRLTDRPSGVASRQLMTNCKPTVDSSVAIAASSGTDHVWSPTIPSTPTSTPRLKRLDRCLGVRAEDTVDALRIDAPPVGGAVREHRLQALDDRAGGSHLERGHRPTAGQRSPGQGPDDAVDLKAGTVLELFDGLVRDGSEVAVHDHAEVRGSPQRALHAAHGASRRTELDGGLSGVRHDGPPRHAPASAHRSAVGAVRASRTEPRRSRRAGAGCGPRTGSS